MRQNSATARKTSDLLPTKARKVRPDAGFQTIAGFTKGRCHGWQRVRPGTQMGIVQKRFIHNNAFISYQDSTIQSDSFECRVS